MNVPKKKQIIIAVIVIVLVTAGIAIARKFMAPAKITYITAPAVRMDLEESVLATGILKAFKTVAVGAQVNGQLKTLHVALGAKVKRDSCWLKSIRCCRKTPLRMPKPRLKTCRHRNDQNRHF